MPLECAAFFGDFEGGNTKAGREGSSVVTQFNHKIYRPVDDQTGEVRGTRVHGAVELLLQLDKGTPERFKRLSEGKQLGKVEIKFYRVNPEEGIEEHYFQHTLERVKVASQEVICPDTKDPQLEKQPHLERVSLLYEKLTMEQTIDAIVHTDSWEA